MRNLTRAVPANATRAFWAASRWMFYPLAALLATLVLVLWVMPPQLPAQVGCSGSIAMFGVECAGFAGAETIEWSVNLAMFVLFFLPVLGADCFLGGEACDYFGPWIAVAGVSALLIYVVAAATPMRWAWRLATHQTN